jgi:hypothetical protein
MIQGYATMPQTTEMSRSIAFYENQFAKKNRTLQELKADGR